MSLLNCTLNLIYPPISNQEGVWFWENEDVREYTKNSKIYMLVHRKELKFLDIDVSLILEGKFQFKIVMGDFVSSIFSFQFTNDMDMLVGSDPILIESGEKIFRIRREANDEVLYWATPDKILYDIITKNISMELYKEEDIEVLQDFELLYAGISKKNNSFSRLFEEAHHGRLNILSNEHTKESKARMTDELMILLFEIKWFNINVMGLGAQGLDNLFDYTDDEMAIIADAEKAFVSMLDSKYNKVKFKEYPKGDDGLYEKGLEGYIYSINYDLRLFTDKNDFHGRYNNFNGRDSILVYGDDVQIIKFHENKLNKL